MNEDTSLNEFMDAFDASSDYQTDESESAAMEENIATDETTPDTPEEGNSSEALPDDSEEQSAGETEPAAAKQDQAETFTLKVNKEEKTYSREEVISLAQKGADYDRVKEQLAQSRQNTMELQSKLEGQKDAMDLLEDLAKESGTDVAGILRNLQLGLLKKQGLSEDAANERLLRMATEKENAALKAAATESQQEETGAQRAKRELVEFREEYPDVELSKEILDKLMFDVQGGMSLTKAYQKYESTQKDAQIAELQRQLEAEKQNRENRAASPGSQKDSGGKRTKSDYDDFMEAFNS